jgi:hypothetical protein
MCENDLLKQMYKFDTCITIFIIRVFKKYYTIIK